MRAVDLIAAKRAGSVHTVEEISWLVNEYVAGFIPDYQMAAWLMAVCFQGLDRLETFALTRAMVATGERVDLSDAGPVVADKHSTGGVGDKVTLVLAPLVAACGVPFAKMSGRGLGHTGGTVDKLESIPGFRTELSVEEFHEQVRRVGVAVVSQTPGLVPADRLLYALRDATATVVQDSLIASSIMSKKIATGATAIVLDVKVGEGAFFEDRARAERVARLMIDLGADADRRVRCLLSSMDEPLGRAVGNTLEVREAFAVLSGRGPADVREVVLRLAGMLLALSGVERDEIAGRNRAREVLDSGEAREVCARWIQAQGGDPGALNGTGLPQAPVVRPYRASRRGWVRRVGALLVARACLGLGAGRETKGARVDHSVGVVIEAIHGTEVAKGDIMAWVHARTPEAAERAAGVLGEAFELGESPPEPERTIISEL
ncbi:MAG: thymidine phosphorylase [Thermoleophilia bacterium]|nr:thymidine phosphorylase [Thermoleophilia bacterium]